VARRLKVLALFDAVAPTTIDADLSAELRTEDWRTEKNVLAALAELGHTTEYLAIFDDLDLLRRKLESFQPDAIFNLADQFKNNRAFDQNIVSFLELHGVPFTGCGSTGLTLCKHKAISKKILGYHRIRVPEFTVVARGKRATRPARLRFPVVVKPLKEEASYGIAQASFQPNGWSTAKFHVPSEGRLSPCTASSWLPTPTLNVCEPVVSERSSRSSREICSV